MFEFGTDRMFCKGAWAWGDCLAQVHGCFLPSDPTQICAEFYRIPNSDLNTAPFDTNSMVNAFHDRV